MGLFLLDRNVRYEKINEWLAAVNGFAVDEHVGRSVCDLLGEVSDGTKQQFGKVLETGSRWSTALAVSGNTEGYEARKAAFASRDYSAYD